MVVIVLESVPVGLRGELTRWLLEPRTNVFVGTVSAIVRDRLWDRIRSYSRSGAAMLLHSTDNEQGFAIRVWGNASREIVNFDGLNLVRIPR